MAQTIGRDVYFLCVVSWREQSIKGFDIGQKSWPTSEDLPPGGVNLRGPLGIMPTAEMGT